MYNFLRGCSILENRIPRTGKRIRRKCGFFLKEYCEYVGGRSLQDVMSMWKVKFEKSNVNEADVSARLIASHVLGVSDLEKLSNFHEHELNDREMTEFNRCGECRLAKVPIQYIIQKWDFRDVKLKMLPPVFIPRPETEQLIDIVAANTVTMGRGLEIGCGSGAISIAMLKKFPNLCMDAIDRSAIACNLALENAELNQVADRIRIVNSRLQEDGTILKYQVESTIEFIVSNPPYLLSSELSQLDPEILLYEDLRALDGGRDGLKVIKHILLLSSRVLMRSRKCFLEVHHHHAHTLRNWLEKNSHLKLKYGGSFKDCFGKDRFVCVVKE